MDRKRPKRSQTTSPIRVKRISREQKEVREDNHSQDKAKEKST
jgi:hypothetical protein